MFLQFHSSLFSRVSENNFMLHFCLAECNIDAAVAWNWTLLTDFSMRIWQSVWLKNRKSHVEFVEIYHKVVTLAPWDNISDVSQHGAQSFVVSFSSNKSWHICCKVIYSVSVYHWIRWPGLQLQSQLIPKVFKVDEVRVLCSPLL